jgi:hypothetical protein
MKVLLTGCDGYIGVRMGHYALGARSRRDRARLGFHRVGWLYDAGERRPQT